MKKKTFVGPWVQTSLPGFYPHPSRCRRSTKSTCMSVERGWGLFSALQSVELKTIRARILIGAQCFSPHFGLEGLGFPHAAVRAGACNRGPACASSKASGLHA